MSTVVENKPAQVSGASTMAEVLATYPGAQRALFRKYHIGGCSSCAFEPSETLAELLVIYDHLGTRSMDAAAYFLGHGFNSVRALRGGIDAWSQEIDPGVRRYNLQ